jgi:hypothetical protein
VAWTFRRTPCVQSKEKKKLAPTPHTQSSKFLWQRAKGWVSIYSRSLIPVHAMNRDQCSVESHVPCWGSIGPDSCHKPGSIPQNEPGPAPKRHEPGPMPVIGPDLPTEPGHMAFVSWTKDPFSTSASQPNCPKQTQ